MLIGVPENLRLEAMQQGACVQSKACFADVPVHDSIDDSIGCALEKRRKVYAARRHEGSLCTQTQLKAVPCLNHSQS